MNTYISSSFNTENFSNTKSSFSNSLKLELGENPGLELRSILIDTRAVIHEFYKEPIVVVCSKIPKIYNSNKNYSDDKLADIFDLIKKGGIITKGELFNYFDELIIA